MTRRARLAALLIGLVVALLGAQSAHADDPTLHVRYTMNCTFTITGDTGGAISVIPPGKYQVLVTSPQEFAEPDVPGETDPNVACGGALSFRLTGPGVDLRTTLEEGSEIADQLQATFQLGTYVAQEDRRPTVTRTVITVSNAAASTGGGSSGGSSAGSSGGGSSSPTNTKTNDKSNVPFRGTLDGKVSAVGKLTLSFKGARVTSLKAGRYRIVVDDKTKKAGLLLQQKGQKPFTISPVASVGKRTVTLRLRAGQWSFYSPVRKPTSFRVDA